MKVIDWLGDHLRIINQVELPANENYSELKHYKEVIHAIKTLQIRGAPAIGIATAYGIAIGANSIKTDDQNLFQVEFEKILREFSASRPTAVNLFHAVEAMRREVSHDKTIPEIKRTLVQRAESLHHTEAISMEKLSRLGAGLLHDGATILTHCNTGQLATGVEYGTALGIIKFAAEHGFRIHVYADETRPLLQGARLTAWELQKLDIPVTLICDNMAGYFLRKRMIDMVIVGADRIAANGDTANKIGTYSLSIMAREHQVPFYIAAPISTIDLTLSSGDDIPIEERGQLEVVTMMGVQTAPAGTRAANPAFDVTPADNITAIITENGIARKPFQNTIERLIEEVR